MDRDRGRFCRGMRVPVLVLVRTVRSMDMVVTMRVLVTMGVIVTMRVLVAMGVLVTVCVIVTVGVGVIVTRGRSVLAPCEDGQFLVQRVISHFERDLIEQGERTDWHALGQRHLLDAIGGHAVAQQGHRLVQVAEERVVAAVERADARGIQALGLRQSGLTQGCRRCGSHGAGDLCGDGRKPMINRNLRG